MVAVAGGLGWGLCVMLSMNRGGCGGGGGRRNEYLNESSLKFLPI